jgi:hypothetical protein
MKLTKKQEAIKAKILAGTHVGDLRELVSNKRTQVFEVIDPKYVGIGWDFIGYNKGVLDAWFGTSNNNGRPIINMSEWFEESEEPSESTKDMREYDEKLIVDYNVLIVKYNLAENLTKARKQFIDQRYPKEALLKEKAEIEARLKEIEQQLGIEG